MLQKPHIRLHAGGTAGSEHGGAKTAMWYLAELVMKIIAADDPRNLCIKTWFLYARMPLKRHMRKLFTSERTSETSYENSDGKAVQITFEGLSDLDSIDEELEDGAELTFHYKSTSRRNSYDQSCNREIVCAHFFRPRGQRDQTIHREKSLPW